MDCPFCDCQSDGEQRIVLESTHCLFIQKPQSVLIGSGLIVPKHHRETVFDLTVEEWNNVYKLLADVKCLLDRTYDPQRSNER